MIEIDAKLVWNGELIKGQMKRRLHNNLKNALSLFLNTLKAKLSRDGAEHFHSLPGEPPLVQSANLINSLEWSITEDAEQKTGIVSTDALYAQTLEFGGTLQAPSSSKIHATRPIQGWKKPVTIAPRPAWMPVWMALQDKIKEILASGFK